jgi:hypothetical protein
MKETRIVKYEIEGIPGFENVEFTESSGSRLTVPQAFEFARKHNSTLQSLREAMAVRIDANGMDHADDWQWTRTGAIYVPEGKKVYVAFDDSFMEEFAQRGYDAHVANKPLILSAKDKPIVQAIERARDTKRFVEVAKQGDLEIALSKFGTHEIAVAVAQDMAAPYASHLKDKEYSNGHVWLLKPELAEGKVEVRPVGLGVDDYGSSVNADFNFLISRQARGVRPAQKISTGSKGKLVGSKK